MFCGVDRRLKLLGTRTAPVSLNGTSDLFRETDRWSPGDGGYKRPINVEGFSIYLMDGNFLPHRQSQERPPVSPSGA